MKLILQNLQSRYLKYLTQRKYPEDDIRLTAHQMWCDMIQHVKDFNILDKHPDSVLQIRLEIVEYNNEKTK